jgi:hypothetical protein
MPCKEETMLTSVPGLLPRFALPMLSVIVLSLSGAPSPAQAPGMLAPGRAPGQVVETIGTAATVVSTMHYQAELGLTCIGGTCSGAFPHPGARRQLNVTRMSCLMGSSGSTFSHGVIELVRADGSHVLSQYLPGHHSSLTGFHPLNRAVDVQVAARHHIDVFLILTSGTATFASCTVIGTLDTLQ